MTGFRILIPGAALVFVLAAALYAPALQGGFAYDSIGQVVYGDYIHRTENLAEVLTLRVVALDELDRNRPLHLASLMADAAVWGRNPSGYRLTSVLLHALNAALVFAIIMSALVRAGACNRGAFAAIFGALLFALHPLVVEAVSEPSNREDLLLLLPVLVGILVIICARSPLSWFAVNASLALCAFLAVTAKESGVAAPFIFVATVLLFDAGRLRKFVPGLVAGLLAVTGFLAASYMFRPLDSAVFLDSPPPLAADFWTALGVQSRIWTLQLFQVFRPANLSAHYQSEVLSGITLPLAVTVLVAAAGAAAIGAWKNRLVALGLAVTVLTLLPASNFAAQFQPVADRYLYAPLAGGGMIAAALVAGVWGWACGRWSRTLLIVAACAVLAAEYSANFRRQQVWREPLALWSDVVRQFPRAPIAHMGLANAHYRAGRFDAARAAAAECVLASGARWDDALALRAICEWQTGQHDEAVATFRRAVVISPIYLDQAALGRSMAWSPAQMEVLARLAQAAGR